MDPKFLLWRSGTELPDMVPFPDGPSTMWSGWLWIREDDVEDAWPGYFETNVFHRAGHWVLSDSVILPGLPAAWVPMFHPPLMTRKDLG